MIGATTAEQEHPTVDNSTSAVVHFNINVKDILPDALNEVHMTILMAQQCNDARHARGWVDSDAAGWQATTCLRPSCH
jgi:hypothetical protein